MKTLKWIPLIVCIAFVGMGNQGCDPQPTEKIAVTPKVAPSTNQVETVEQFTITSKGTFRAGYDNEVREIFILKDNFTGDEYLGITDCTLIKRIKKEKAEATAELIDAAADLAGAFAE